MLLAFAHSERQSRYHLADVATMARRDGAGFVLDGAKTLVLHGDSADKLLVSARVSGERRDPQGIGLFVVDAGAKGVARRGYRTIDGQHAGTSRNDVNEELDRSRPHVCDLLKNWPCSSAHSTENTTCHQEPAFHALPCMATHAETHHLSGAAMGSKPGKDFILDITGYIE